jgi:hypothetical protein
MEDLPELDTEESIPAWGAALENHEGSLGRLFVGDLRAEQDEYDDPNVLFAGRQLVAEIAVALDGLNEDYFARIFLERAENEREAWLYEPLQKFFSSARQNGSAVVVMWEN